MVEPGDLRFDFLKRISVELSIALFDLGFSLVGVQVATLYIQKTCRVGSYFFGNQTFSADVCNNLFNGSFDEAQKIVQSVTKKENPIELLLSSFIQFLISQNFTLEFVF